MVSDGLKIQNVIVADKTKAVKLVLWQSDIESLITGKTYRFHSFVIKTFQAEKYIQWPKVGATITDTKSLDTVVEDDVNIFDTVDECEIAGVMSLDCYLACANCKGKTVEKTDLLIVCNKCGMVQKKVTAQHKERVNFFLACQEETT